MKRDMDLIREMLLEIEANPDPMDGPSLDIGGRSRDEISYHVMLMHQAGLIDAWDCSSVDEICWYPKDLTWEGHEFLEAARDPARWQKAKDIFDKLEGGQVFEIVKGVLDHLVEEEVTRHLDS